MSETTKPEGVDPRVSAIEDNGITFPLLTLDQQELLEAEIKNHLIEHFKSIAKASDLVPAEVYGVIKDAIPETIDLNDTYRYVATAKGIKSVLLRSLGTLPNAKAVIQGYRGTNGTNLAMAVCGLATRMTPIEIEGRNKEIADRAAGLFDREENLKRRLLALDIGEAEANEAEQEQTPESPPGGGVSGP
jgi:hypothetical protein